jgi:hypothetical protein
MSVYRCVHTVYGPPAGTAQGGPVLNHLGVRVSRRVGGFFSLGTLVFLQTFSTNSYILANQYVLCALNHG